MVSLEDDVAVAVSRKQGLAGFIQSKRDCWSALRQLQEDNDPDPASGSEGGEKRQEVKGWAGRNGFDRDRPGQAVRSEDVGRHCFFFSLSILCRLPNFSADSPLSLSLAGLSATPPVVVEKCFTLSSQEADEVIQAQKEALAAGKQLVLTVFQSEFGAPSPDRFISRLRRLHRLTTTLSALLVAHPLILFSPWPTIAPALRSSLTLGQTADTTATIVRSLTSSPTLLVRWAASLKSSSITTSTDISCAKKIQSIDLVLD